MKTETKPMKPIEILLVEDNSGDASLIHQAFNLSKRPVRLKVSPNGEDALAYLRQEGFYHNLPNPDFILLDLGLPKKSGWEVLSEIKEDWRLNKIPVLILTGSPSNDDTRKACFSQADDYLLKPRDWLHFNRLLNYLEATWLKDNSSGW